MEKMIWLGNGSFRIEIKVFVYIYCVMGMIFVGVFYGVLVFLNVVLIV